MNEYDEQEEQRFYERHPLHFIRRQLHNIERKLEKIMATQADEAAALTAFGVQLDKATAEIIAAVQALKDALAAAGGTTPEVDAATAALGVKVQALDDLNADAPPAVSPPA